MPVNINRSIKATRDGVELVLGASDNLRQETEVTMVCDGPRCGAHNTAAPVPGGSITSPSGPTSVTFVQEKVGEDASALPDAFARFLKLGVDPFDIKEYCFCGPRCVKDFLDYSFVPAKSPRERTAELQANSNVEQAIAATE